jgi:lysophospholipase L1-like esterase
MEGGSRILIPREDIQPLFNDEQLRTRGRAFVIPHPLRGFALKPGFSNGMYRVNQQGFRGKDFPGSIGKQKRILTLGESTTFGWGVKDNQTYPFFLMNQFSKTDNVYVVNGGVPSYTSSQTLAYLEEILIKGDLRPDIVLINILWNDIWYSTVSNWHPDILIYQKPPSWITWLTKNSRFVYGVLIGFSETKNQVDVFNEKALHQYEKNIEQMILTCRPKGVKLIFVEPPFDADHMPESGLNEFQVKYSKSFFISMAHIYTEALHRMAQNHGVPVLAHGLDIRYLHQEPLFLDALHPTPQGNALMALDIYKSLNQIVHETVGKEE